MKEEYVASGFSYYLTCQMTCYYKFPTWEQIIPNVGTAYSQRGKNYRFARLLNKNITVSKQNHLFSSHLIRFFVPLQRILHECACGGIGRRARLRIWCLTTCRFESC